MQSTQLEIVIVGGSLAGLFTGIVLQSLSNVAKITILERLQFDQLQDLGAGIRLNQEAVDSISELFNTPPEKYAVGVNAYRMLDHEGKVYFDQPTQGWTTSWGQLYRTFRAFFDADPKCSYRHGCTVENVYERAESSMGLTFVNEKQEIEEVFASIVIGADGASSKTRSLMLPEVVRTSAGYVCYRGIVLESELSEDAAKFYNKAGTFSWPTTGQFVSYIIPGDEAPADQAVKTVNWVWYRNKSDDDLRELMTDKHGRLHQFQLPHGSMKPEEINKVKVDARREIPSLHAEVVEKTVEPFIQVVTDSMASSNCFFDGKLLLVGDAVGGQRPHTASAIMQGTYHALMLHKLLRKEIDIQRWTEETLRLSMILVNNGQELGTSLMSGDPPGTEKVPQYLKLFMGTQKELNTLWTQTIGIGHADGKM